MDSAELIDAIAPEPVLVIGSLPPAGRDIDLLVSPAAASKLAQALSANGFCVHGSVWARFADGAAHIVELIPAANFDLGPDQLDQLYAQARPIDGRSSLLRPAPHHQLLLAARRAAKEAGIGAKRRVSVNEAGAQDWLRARETAPMWRAETALGELEQAFRGEPPRSWRWHTIAARGKRYRRGAVIALSGLDGSGKSTQAEALEQALTALGYPVVRIWTSLSAHPSLARVAAPARAVFDRRSRQSTGEQERPAAGEDHDRLTRLRESRPLLHLAWVSFVATMNAWWQARAVRPHLLRGRVVICDRYTLDSLVHLRYRYGSRSRYRLQLALIRLLSPRPLRAYLLDVSPQTAYTRNQEYTPEQVELRARLYREEYPALGVERLDGERPREQLREQLALDVWSALRSERDAGGRALLQRLLAILHRGRRR
ncbi:MAG TPA: hypothetical protein VGF15_03935 [Solirubrobacteraceae bacterium]